MTNLKITLSYEGTRYSGFQRQGNTQNTIQAKLENVLSRIFEEEVEVVGSGRTDAGVHALMQVVNVKTKRRVPENLFSLLNEYLPEDIRIQQIEEVDERFHARFHVKSKTYRYLIERGPENPLTRRFTLHDEETIDVSKLKKASSLFLGTHDFLSYTDNKRSKKSTVRTIQKISIEEQGSLLSLEFTGDGFLYHMIRLIVGDLLLFSKGKLSLEAIEAKLCLEEGERNLAPSHGLTLLRVEYDK
ncbi:tRNA pseudouridine(38-40) synthase TruA [Guggenheimella bovis]